MALIHSVETNTLLVVTQEGRNEGCQQAVLDPNPPRPMQSHYPPQFPSARLPVQGLSEQTSGSQAGVPDRYHFQQVPYLGSGGWYRPSAPDPHLQVYPFTPLGSPFGQYHGTDDPHAPLPTHPQMESPHGYNYPPIGFDMHNGYYYGLPNPQYHLTPAHDGSTPLNPGVFCHLPMPPNIAHVYTNQMVPTTPDGLVEGSGGNK